MTVWDEASRTFFLGVEVYSFGLFVALGLALALIVLALLLRKAAWKKGTVELTGVLALVLGLVVSRLFFGLMDEALGQRMPLWAMLRLSDGGYSMMGALFGVCMGAIVAARLTGQHAPRLLDYLAPAFLLFVACERLGESAISDYGISRILKGTLFQGSFLATEDEYGWHLLTYMIESFLALVLSLVLIRDLKKERRGGDTFLLFMLLFGASQILMESLRHDGHMTVNAFVRLEQVMSMMLLGTAVIVLSLRRWHTRRGLAAAALILIPIVTGAGVGIEFLIDRTATNRYLLYALFLAVVSVPAGLGIALRREA